MNISNEVKVGIFFILAITGFIVGMNYMKGSKMLSNSLFIHAKYKNVEGLIKGNPVMYGGIKIGKVKKLSLVGDSVRVDMEITDQEMHIPIDSKAEIYSSDILGNQAIRIIVGKKKQNLEQEARLPGIVEEGLFDKVGPLAEQVQNDILVEISKLVKELNSVVGVTGKAVDDSKGDVGSIIGNLEETTANIARLTGNLDELLASVEDMAASSANITKNLDNNQDNINDIVANAKTMTDDLKKTTGELDQVMADAKSTLGNVKTLSEKFGSTDNTVGMLLNDRKIYDDISEITENAKGLLDDARQSPSQYIPNIYLIERKKKN